MDDFTVRFFPWFGQLILGFLCVGIRFPQAPLVLVGVFLQLSNAKIYSVAWMCARLPSVSAFLHELAALVLDLRTEIAWGFEEAQRGVRETLPRVSLFLKEVIKGALSWSCCPRNIPKR